MSKIIKHQYARPRLVISRCLGFANCRYNGDVINNDFVRRLAEFCEVITPCPEVEIGLPVPRDPIRVVEDEYGSDYLMQPATGDDFSLQMLKYAGCYLNSLEDVDGFILKAKSPSCGRGTVKVYRELDGKIPLSHKTDGFFARSVKDIFPLTPFEDEGRLNNYILRERFLTQIFTLASFRAVAAEKSIAALQNFHASNKELLRFYNQQAKIAMGRLLGEYDGGDIGGVLDKYSELLLEAMASHPKPAALTNFFEHALGFFKNELNAGDKKYFLEQIEQWREGRLPVSALITLVRSWALHFESDWLLEQTVLQPYPVELNDIHDSGKGRDL